MKQTEYIIKVIEDRSTKIVTFITPRAGVLTQGRGHISHSKNALFFLSILFFLLPGIDQTN